MIFTDENAYFHPVNFIIHTKYQISTFSHLQITSAGLAMSMFWDQGSANNRNIPNGLLYFCHGFE
jgi:hypothetical protein